ncbi:MAG: protein kinase domain-containing protein, partial [Desulfuromonadales bacterium]
MQVSLTVVEGPQKGKTFEFSEPDTFLLGRDAAGSNAHFRLGDDDTQVSRNHFLLEINPPECFIRDAGSLNGTFIVRPVGKQVYFLAGRNDDKASYAKRAETLQQKLGYQSLEKVDERLKLDSQDIIHVGQTAISVDVTIPPPRREPPPDQVSDGHCIECGVPMPSPAKLKRPDQLCVDDFICAACQAKRRKPKSTLSPQVCCECGKDVTKQAHSDGRADDLRSVALYQCDACTERQLSGQRVYTIAKTYTLLRQLGEGGFGVVYLARHNPTDRLVALKITKEAVKQEESLILRFKREIAIMQRLVHPHLVRLYDEGITPDGNCYLVSEYIPRGNLLDFGYQRFGEKMPVRTACQLVAQASEGLEWFHGKGYVHRDIKPENILVGKTGDGYVAKLADFGLAKNYLLHGGTITGANEWSGTILFCPPEQIIDFKNARPCNDIYAMGMTLYSLIAGGFPY